MSEKRLKTPLRSFLGIEPPLSDYTSAAAVIIPVPYDGTMEWRKGAKEAPAAIIEASDYLEYYDLELKTETHRCGIHTMPQLDKLGGGPKAVGDKVYRAVCKVVKDGKLPVVLGGEHSISYGVVKSVLERYPGLTVLQLDAHTDMRDSYRGSRWSDACVMRRVSEICPVVQVGIRSSSLEEQRFLERMKRRPVYANEIRDDSKTISRVLGMLGREVYVTIDLDVFDPSLMPAVGTPEPGGLGWYEVTNLLKQVGKTKHIIGFDIVELCPAEGPAACVYTAAALAYRMIGYAVTGGNNG